MTPAQIRKNLATRLQIARAAAARERKFLAAQGYDSEAVDSLLPGAASSGPAPRARASAPARREDLKRKYGLK